MTPFDYSGQWLGSAEGDSPGRLLLDLDLDKASGISHGIAYLFSTDPVTIPSSFAEVKFHSEESSFSVETTPRPFNAANGRILTSIELQTYFKEAQFPDIVEIKLTRSSDDRLDVIWSTNIGTKGKGESGEVTPIQTVYPPQ